mmetsp:Transcript_25385/g.70123  ORF Transcript_25385/g.70123 Transcript_25385/m.70123 type:complete len:252 (-) Transcript_25385:403-1158(-)
MHRAWGELRSLVLLCFRYRGLPIRGRCGSWSFWLTSSVSGCLAECFDRVFNPGLTCVLRLQKTCFSEIDKKKVVSIPSILPETKVAPFKVTMDISRLFELFKCIRNLVTIQQIMATFGWDRMQVWHYKTVSFCNLQNKWQFEAANFAIHKIPIFTLTSSKSFSLSHTVIKLDSAAGSSTLRNPQTNISIISNSKMTDDMNFFKSWVELLKVQFAQLHGSEGKYCIFGLLGFFLLVPQDSTWHFLANLNIAL